MRKFWLTICAAVAVIGLALVAPIADAPALFNGFSEMAMASIAALPLTIAAVFAYAAAKPFMAATLLAVTLVPFAIRFVPLGTNGWRRAIGSGLARFASRPPPGLAPPLMRAV